MRRYNTPNTRVRGRSEPMSELSLSARRAAAGEVNFGVAARGWLAVSIVGLVLILLVVCITFVNSDDASTRPGSAVPCPERTPCGSR